MNSIELLKDLSNAFGPSGFENETVEEVKKYAPQNSKIEEDTLRNLYIQRPQDEDSQKPVVMLDAHTDEVGFMVQSIRPNGLLNILPLGGWVANTVPAHRFYVKAADGKLHPGIVGAKPPHYMSETERKAPLEIAQMVLDIGAFSAQEVREEFKIEVGAPIAPDTQFEYNEQTGLITGKAFDCRAGCAALLESMHSIWSKELAIKPVAAFASQEEVGCRGSIVTSRKVKPDVAIVFEGCPADDNFAEGWAIQTGLRRGPMLRHIDNTMITNPAFMRFTLNIAKENGISVQQAVRTGGGTNGSKIHIANLGVPTIVIGLPVRYIHSHYSVASLEDYQNFVKLGIKLIENLTPEVISSF